MPARPIIIDTDPGQDDAVALLTALAARDRLEVLGLTTVAGNVPLELTTANALRILELAARPEVPVYAGCPRPILRPLVTAPEIHGEDGIEGADLPPPTIRVQARHAVPWMIDAIMAAPKPVTLCTLGPLTNLALALVMEPRIVTRIEEVVAMGGAFGGGEAMPTAEFNIHVDPEAAAVVFSAGLKLTLIPLNCTYQVRATPERLRAIAGVGTRAAAVVAAMMSCRPTSEGGTGRPLHDVCVIMRLLDPKLFAGERVAVAIETGSDLTHGITVADWRRRRRAPENATVVMSADPDRFFERLLSELARLP